MIRWFANCIPVHGAARTLLYDLQFGTAEEVPREFADVLTRGIGVQELGELFGDDGLALAAGFVARGQAGRWEDSGLYPEIDWTGFERSTLECAVLDLGPTTTHDPAALLNELAPLGCREVLVRVADTSRDLWCRDLDQAAGRLQIAVQWRGRQGIGTAPQAPGGSTEADEAASVPVDLDRVLTARPDAFVITTQHFARSRRSHPMFNGRLHVRANGEFGMAAGSALTLGVFGHTAIADVVASSEVQRFWATPREADAGCARCEFRYACTDERPPETGMPCPYDPTVGTWAQTDCDPD